MAVLDAGIPGSARLASVCLALAVSGVAPLATGDLGLRALQASEAPKSQASAAELEQEGERLARRYAPNFLQRTSPDYPERDRPLPVDFDGDWDATNNWVHLRPEHARLTPAVYGSWILSETHAYLTYVLFYPRDWTTLPCVPYVCHDNDLEAALVVVERDARSVDDALVLVETKFHARYMAIHGKKARREPDGRPSIIVESEGHGMLPVQAGEGLDDASVVSFLEGSSDLTRPNAQRYELLSLRDTLWARRAANADAGRLWTEGDAGFLGYSGTRFGELGRSLGAAMAVRHYAGGVRPPWAIGADGPRGDWFFDPAYVALSRHGGWFVGQRASLSYALNTYVDDLRAECEGARCARTQGAMHATGVPPGGLLTALGLLLFRFGRRLRGGSARGASLPPAR